MAEGFVDTPDVPIWRLVLWTIQECAEHLLYVAVQLVMNIMGLMMLARKRFKVFQQLQKSGTRHATGSGDDANASAVGFYRYLHCGQPDVFPDLDPSLRRFEWIFMSRTRKFLALFVEAFPLVLRAATQVEGGLLAARTTVIDALVTNFLTGGPESSFRTLGGGRFQDLLSANCNDDESNKTEYMKDSHVSSGLPTALHRPSASDGPPSNVAAPSPTGSTTSSYSTGSAHDYCSNPAGSGEQQLPTYHRQLIILGAGFDSRPYRLPAVQANRKYRTSVIEVDQSTVQARKLERLEAGIGREELARLTRHVEYVACNFEHPNALADALLSSKSFNPSVPTFVLWEGVTYYLPLVAVRSTLQTLTNLRAMSSIPAPWHLVFDYIDDMCFLEWRRVPQQLTWAAMAALNHPCKSAFPHDPRDFASLLGQYGIEICNVWSCKEVIARLSPKLKSAADVLGINFASCKWSSGSGYGLHRINAKTASQGVLSPINSSTVHNTQETPLTELDRENIYYESTNVSESSLGASSNVDGTDTAHHLKNRQQRGSVQSHVGEQKNRAATTKKSNLSVLVGSPIAVTT